VLETTELSASKKEDTMAERQQDITPVRDEARLARPRASGWQTSPFFSLQRLADEMDRMFDDFGFGRHAGRFPFWRESAGWAPEVDVFQKNNELTIRADLPGLKKEEVSVDVLDNAVRIHGERRREHAEEREGYHRSERSYGSFSRTIPVPEGAITEQARAEFRDGVLEITMPSPPASKGRRLEISEGSRK
jgi:HSP20 family protein